MGAASDTRTSSTSQTSSAEDISVKNEVEGVDLDHNRRDLKAITDILDGNTITEEEGHSFSTRETRKFSRASGDDQGVHYNLNPRTIQNFHKGTGGIMADNPEAYTGEPIDREELADTERFIVPGALVTSMAISKLYSELERKPTAIKAMHNRPVKHHPEGSHQAAVDDSLDVHVDEYDIPAATHEILEPSGEEENGLASKESFDMEDVREESPGFEDSAEIDYTGSAYALSKGMSFGDRNGDVLLGFLEINFSEYDFDNLEELEMEERKIVEDSDNLEYFDGDIPDAEAMRLDHIDDAEVNAYRNRVVDQKGEEVIEYTELNLQGVDYEEHDDSIHSFNNTYSNMMESMARLMTPL